MVRLRDATPNMASINCYVVLLNSCVRFYALRSNAFAWLAVVTAGDFSSVADEIVVAAHCLHARVVVPHINVQRVPFVHRFLVIVVAKPLVAARRGQRERHGERDDRSVDLVRLPRSKQIRFEGSRVSSPCFIGGQAEWNDGARATGARHGGVQR